MSQDLGGISVNLLKQYIEKIQHLEEEKANISDEMKEIYGSAKSDGFEPKIIRQIVKEMRMKDRERSELEQLSELLDMYRSALGLIPN